MARRKAPRRRRPGASKGSLGTKGNQRPAGDPSAGVELVMRPSPAGSAAQGPAEGRDKATEIARTVFSLPCLLAVALVSLWRHLLSMCLLAAQKMALQKKAFLQVFLLLPLALAAVYCGTSLPGLKPLWNCPVLMAQQTQKMQLMLEEVARLRAEISSVKQEVEEMKQAASERALEAYVEMSDWALQSSGASIDLQRTSETYTCKKDWFWRFIEFFCTPRSPDRILQPDVSPGNCWPFPGRQGQVVIRLPARVHLTAITVQHISKEVSPSGTVTSAPRDIAVFGVDVDGEEETLLVTFMYDVAKEAIQTFPLKNAPHPRAFSYLKLLVKSNWGNPKYTCIYRVQVHGKMAKPNSFN
ncbi:sperm-associated antigen 4 protein-like isoform X3 [Rissa tridactyla]|uniref:sperm-associated antigen 4 protein-like isoform X3 n=1 Tax=Rissa tridactyla TaxID=75485 RepID=UPI0023BAEB75|nr:sperm-associated antigen 4 protein-like isoform X3 [Rissa tridactyla]XP_054038841.1 sperm-associated antigen 4 protein-like isoform X3 [Rissa tridactyla]XP_054038842.1 sperm-associated antigen 4 protein-like isoform X3 [Rissa tridactyla]